MFKDFSDEERQEYLENILDLLLPNLSPKDTKALLKRFPSYEEDPDGNLFEEYVEAIHLLPYLEKPSVSLETKCKIASNLDKVFSKYGIDTGTLKFFIKSYCAEILDLQS